MRRTLTLIAAAVAIAFPAAAQTQADKDLATEARLAAKYPGFITRSGKTLRIGRNSFTDEGKCRDEETSCVTYRADAVYGRYVGIWSSGYETSDYMLVEAEGFPTAIGHRPVTSPSGKRFFVLSEFPHQWNPLEGAAVWNWSGLRRLRVVDPALAEVQRFVAWRGDSCVEIVGRRQYPDPYQPMWLAEQDGDWRLTRRRPPICTG